MASNLYEAAGKDARRACLTAKEIELINHREADLKEQARRAIQIAMNWKDGVRYLTGRKDAFRRVEVAFLKKLEQERIFWITTPVGIFFQEIQFVIPLDRGVSDWQNFGFNSSELETLKKYFREQ